jgi:hypothetical protein
MAGWGISQMIPKLIPNVSYDATQNTRHLWLAFGTKHLLFPVAGRTEKYLSSFPSFINNLQQKISRVDKSTRYHLANHKREVSSVVLAGV